MEYVLTRLLVRLRRGGISLLRRSQLLRWLLVGLLLLVFVTRIISLLESLHPPYLYIKDILQEYVLARATLEGMRPYLPLPTLFKTFIGLEDPGILPHPTPHPPSLIPFVLPFGLFSYRFVVILWLVLECVSLLIISRLLMAEFGFRTTVGFALLFMALVGWFPVSMDLLYGQLMVPLLLCLFLILRWMNHKPLLAGVLLGIGVAVKLLIWPLWLYFALRGKWRVLVASVLVFTLACSVAGFLIGIDELVFYFFDVGGQISRLYRACTYNYSITTLGWRLFDGAKCELFAGLAAPPLLKSDVGARIVSTSLVLGSTLVLMYFSKTCEDLDIAYGIAVCVSILMSPVVWYHYFLLLILPLSLIVKRAWRRESETIKLVWVAFIVLLFNIPESVRDAFLIWISADVHIENYVVVPFSAALLTLLPVVAVSVVILLLLWDSEKRRLFGHSI